MRIGFRFRTTLIAFILALLLGTVSVVGITSFLSARETAESLSSQVLAQTAERIEGQVRSELDVALGQSRLDTVLFEHARIDPANREEVSRYFIDAIQAHPQLSYLSWSLDASGAHVEMERDRDGALALVHLVRTEDGRLELRHMRVAADGKREEVEVLRNKPENDPRPRPYYLAAKQANVPTWTETYVFFAHGKLTVPGVTRASPVHRPDGTLLGVLSADFDLFALSEFLATLRLGQHGMAFLVELRANGEKRVIAHPKPELLTRGDKGDLVPGDEIDDARVRAFLPRIDPDVPAEQLVPVSFDAEGTRYVGGYRRLDGDRGLRWAVALVLPEDDILGPVTRNRQTTIAITIASTILAIVLAIILSTRIASTLRKLAAETEAISTFRLEPKPVLESSVIEVQQLAVAIEDMKRGLRSFQKFVPTDVVRKLVASGREASLGGTRATITVHFSDIAGFTSIAETLDAEELVDLLSEYLSAMSSEILASRGTIDKYIGDAIMAFWGAPEPLPDHALVACRTVLANQRALAKLRVQWEKEGRPPIHSRVGLHTGVAIVGNVGSDARLDFTAMGDTVNLASRIEGLGKNYGVEILISEATYDLVRDHVVARPVDRVAVKGKAQGVLLYELLGLAGDVDDATEKRAARHARAMDAYFGKRWDEALELLDDADDKAALVIAERARAFRTTPPPDDWDGIHRMTSK